MVSTQDKTNLYQPLHTHTHTHTYAYILSIHHSPRNGCWIWNKSSVKFNNVSKILHQGF